MPEALPRPAKTREDLGAQYATGLISHVPPKVEHHGTRSTDFVTKRESNIKSQQFFNYDGRVLKFLCIERKTSSGNNSTEKITKPIQMFALYYYLADDTVEVRLVKGKKISVDDATLLMKRCKLPKNWRTIQRGEQPEYYTPDDLMCGNTVDCYGRYMTLVDCDMATRRVYEEVGISQEKVDVQEMQDAKYVHAVPGLGDLFLAIGSEEYTLNTVFGAHKAAKDYERVEFYRGKVLRARVRIITDHYVDTTRVFQLSYFMEDDSLCLFEEQGYNSGLIGGTFLRRGKYMNHLPSDSTSPRPFKATDIYLSNVISCNGHEFQIFEMDDLTLLLMEDRPQDFPMSDAFRIASMTVGAVYGLREDLRAVFAKKIDREHKFWLRKDQIMEVLENYRITKDLNDQELLTLVRRVKDKSLEQYYYHELCDLYSQIYFIQTISGRRGVSKADGGANNRKDLFLQNLRGRKCHWRRYVDSVTLFVPF
jgi:EF-hand domain-containing protein 1